MAELTVTQSRDFTSESLSNIDKITFGNAEFMAATFSSSQFGPGLISSAVAIDGGLANGTFATIVVKLSTSGTFSAARWTFTNWNSGLGADQLVLVGTRGADALTGTAFADTVSYSNVTGVNGIGVTVVLLNPSLNTGEAAGDTYRSIENLTGSNFRDFLAGTLGANTIIGLDGNDSLFGNDGNDNLDGGLGNDLLDGGNNSDTLNGGDGNDTLNGRFGSDTLDGGVGNDALDGGDANDSLDGGIGDDRLKGGLGSDTLDGSLGVDTADFSDRSGAVVLALSGATDATAIVGGGVEDTVRNIENVTSGAGNDRLTGDGLANVLSSGAGDDTLSGLSGNDTLSSGTGDDILSGGAGADRLIGGLGIDTASYTESGAGVVINLASGRGSGTGIGSSAPGDTLFSIENVDGSNSDDRLIGNSSANVLSGFGGRDFLSGGAGADRLIGGLGIDTASYTESGAGVVINLASGRGSGGNAESDRLSGIENVNGSNFNDTLIGSTSANVLSGADGDDILEGGLDADVLAGGDGTDTASYASGAAVAASLTVPSRNTGGAEGDIYSSIENLTGSAFGDILAGNDQANVIDGGGDADRMGGLGGDDTYLVDNVNDVAIEEVDGGDDRVLASVSYALDAGSQIERLTTTNALSTDAIDLTGNELNQTIIGNAGDNDLTGGLGKDDLNGGDGLDHFMFASAAESTVGAGRDIIRGFQQSQDKIDLQAIDARADLDGDQAFVFRGTARFTDAGGELRFVQRNGNTIVAGDIDGDRIADFQIQLQGLFTLTETDLLL